jgi:nucleotide-binding universal stress UspA family protein
LGSVADEVMRKSPVPVLLTRADSETKRSDTLLPKRILVPLDGSAKSEWIMPSVVAVAEVAQSEIVLLHVLSPHESDALMPAVRDNETDPAYDIVAATWVTRNAADYLEAVAQRYGIPVSPGTALVRVGEPPAVIVDTAAQEAIDLIAVSTHGRSGVRRFALGSVATRIVQNSRLPLLTISIGAIDDWKDRGAAVKTA